MASSHPNGDDAFHNKNYFENNGYPAFDPSLVDTQASSSDQTWAFQPNHMNYTRGFQASAVPQHWQDTHTQATASPTLSQNHPYYGRQFTSTPTQFQDNTFAPSNQFNAFHETPYDPAIVPPSNLGASRYSMPGSRVQGVVVPAKTIAPGALQTQPALPRAKSATPQRQLSSDSAPLGLSKTFPQMPNGTAAGNFCITSPDSLNAVAPSRRLHTFVNIGDQAYDVTITKSTIPAYAPRKSRNEIKQMLASDSRLSAKLSKKITKKSSISAPRLTPRSGSSEASKTKGIGSVSVDSSSEEDDSDESDYESSEDEADMSPLPKVRPTGAVDVVKYDCIKALWRPRSRPASGDDIRDGLKTFWDLFMTIRDRWKSDSVALKSAEESKKNHEIPLLKERVMKQRKMAETALRTAMEQGHPDIIEHFGEYLPLMGALATFLADRLRESEYSGTFALTCLEFISRCKTLTDGALEKTTIAKVLPRYMKRGDKSAQVFAKRIIDNAAAASKNRKDATKSSVPLTQNKDTKEAIDATQKSAATAGVKRTRVGDASNDQPLKKVASASTSGSPTSSGAPKIGAAVKKPVPESKVATLAAPKQVIAKSTSFFSGLQSAAKKPGTSNAAVAAAAKTSVQSTTAEGRTPASAPGLGAFSFAATMANLTKPKEPEPTVKPEETGPPESRQERSKRLRKEERRKLRVSWRPDESLVAVKLFTHDPDEELGHDASQVRHAGDIGSEGRMLKEHRDMMDLDDEDEDDTSLENKPWRDPPAIDFSDINSDERDRNYVPYGGGKQKPDTPERDIQERREANTLMAIYSSTTDIPPSPKEPPADAAGPTPILREFGTPPDYVRERLATYANKPAANTPASYTPASYTPAATVSASAIPTDLSAIFSALGSQPPVPQAPQPAPPQQPQSAAPQTDLEKIFAKFAAATPQAAPVTPQPQQSYQTAQAPLAQTFLGMTGQANQSYGQPAAATAQVAPDLSALLASLAGTVQPAVPAMSMPPQMPPPMAQMAMTPEMMQQQYMWMQQMQAMQWNQQQQGQQQQHAGPPQNHQQYPYENEERRRWRQGNDGANDDDGSLNDVNGFGKRQQKYQGGGGMVKKRDPNRPPPMFVVQCKYFNEGKCKKGVDCTFRHDPL